MVEVRITSGLGMATDTNSVLTVEKSDAKAEKIGESLTPCLINCLIKLNGANKLLGKLAVSSDTDNNNRSIEAVSSRDQHSLNEFALMFEIETEISEKMSRKVKHRVEDLEKTVEEMKIQVDEGDKTNKEYDAVTKDNRRLNDKLDRYRKKLDKADKDYEKLKRRKEQQKNLFDLLKDDSKTLRVENKTLKERIEALERGKKEAITTTSQSLNNGECPMDLSTQESNSPSTAELESKLEESEKKVVELEQKIKDLNGLLVRRKADLERAGDEYGTLDKTCAELRKQLAIATKKSQNSAGSTDNQKDGKSELESELENSNKMINYLNEQMAKLQGQLKTKHSQSEIPIALNHLTKSSLNETDFQALKTKLQAVETELETQKANNKELTIELNRFITNGADEGQQVEFLNMSLIAAQEELKGQSEKLQQLNATLHSTNHKVGVLELNNSHLVSECAFLKDQNEKMKVEKMRITLILDRDLSKEKKKNKKLTKFLSDKDRLHRQYLKQSKIELAHLKEFCENSLRHSQEMSAIPFLSRVLQFPTVPIDCHLVLESLLNHVVSENELQLPVFQPNDEQDWTLSEDLNCCSPECSVFGEAHSETVSSINSPRGSVGSQPPLDRKKLEERIQELEKRLADLTQDYDLLKQQRDIDELNKAANESSTDSATKIELDRLKADMKRLNADRLEIQKKLSSAATKVITAEEKWKVAEGNYQKAKAKTVALNDSLQAKGVELEALKSDHQKLSNDTSSSLKKLTTERDKLKTQLNSTRSKCESLQKQLDGCKKELEHFQHQQEPSAIPMDQGDMEKMKEKYEKMIGALKASIRQTSNMVVEYKKEAQLYKIQLESEGNTPGSCQPTYSGEMLKLQNTNAALSQEISSLKNQIAVASLTQTPTDQELVTRCHKLEYDLVDQQKKNKRLEAELIQSCRAATQPTPADSAVLAKELSKCRKENILLREQNCNLHGRLIGMDKDLYRLKEQIKVFLMR